MAITFNNNSISSVKFNNNSISSVKFNDTEVFNDTITLLMGYDHAIYPNGFILSKTSSTSIYTASTPVINQVFSSLPNSTHGFKFGLSGGNTLDSSHSVTALYDGSSNTGWVGDFRSGVDGIHLTITLPFAIEVVSVTAYKFTGSASSPKYPTKFMVYNWNGVNYDVTSYSGKPAIADTYADFDSSGVATLIATKNNKNVTSLRFYPYGAGTDKARFTLGDIKMEFKVKNTDYEAWKTANRKSSEPNNLVVNVP